MSAQRRQAAPGGWLAGTAFLRGIVCSARKRKLLAAVTEAQACAYKHDVRGFFQVIKRIAPKQTYRRLQLRDDQGTMLTPIEEADLLQSHFRARFQAEPPSADHYLTQEAAALLGPWTLQAAPQLACIVVDARGAACRSLSRPARLETNPAEPLSEPA